jgi:hypothetical protein
MEQIYIFGMKKDLPVYQIGIDLNDPDTQVTFNSLVLNPAHEINYDMFNKVQRFEFSDEENVIIGVAISADTPIYRYDPISQEEYYVVFTKQAIKDIVYDYARRGNFNNVNIEHNSENVVDDVAMIVSYQVDESKGLTAPERFKDVNDGTWIVGYKVTDEIFAKAKAGEWQGFSIEGFFMLTEEGETMEQEMWAKISEELESIRGKFAKMRVSFDFDDTLTTANGQQMAQRHITLGDDVFIVTARQQSNGASVYEMAQKLRIPRENVYFTGGRDKWQTLKRLRIEKHYENNQEQINLIKEFTDIQTVKI